MLTRSKKGRNANGDGNHKTLRAMRQRQGSTLYLPPAKVHVDYELRRAGSKVNEVMQWW
jgi:hypothetical protein